MNNRLPSTIVKFCAALLLVTPAASLAQEPLVQPIPELNASEMRAAIETLQTYCYDCHTGSSAEGGIRVDLFEPDAKLEKHVETIEKILLVIKEQQMPPADADQPSMQERLQALEWIESRLNDFDCGEISRPGRVTMRRLNRVEYNNTVRDLTGLDLSLADEFPSDDVGNGFDNIGDVLTIPPILLEKYVDAASRIADEIVGSEEALKRVFPHSPADPTNLEEAALAAVQNATEFASRAFRRPVTNAESERLFELIKTSWESGWEKNDILRVVLTATLASPHFIYKVEEDRPEDFVAGVRQLNDFELASRLSYFLWSTMPDERLFELARDGKLHTREQLESEVDRMLAEPKAQALVDNFAGQWLQLRDLELLAPDPERFVFDDELRKAMRNETEYLFLNIVRENRSILDLLNADYTFVNERLANHYGMDGISGDDFRRVELSGQRRGVLTHASILLITSNPTRTSPVKRGKWVMDNLLGEPPPPPPPNVPVLDESGETLGTLRQQMEQHRANPNCAVCHTKMDALGFGLENFDAVGKWRSSDGQSDIDASGELPGGRKFEGPVDLVQILAEDKKMEFCRTLTQKLLTYAIGRGLGVQDRCTVRSIVGQVAEDDFKFRTLIKAVVTSPPFTTQESGL